MAQTANSKSTKRFGSRYGKTVKDKFGSIESMQRHKYKCPYCSREQVKRAGTGIWQCKKCDAKFASKAFTVREVPSIQTSVSEL
ncbi:MAG: 50S ribosomal protein L37ae [Nanoarchaeota archaeon]